MELQELNHWWIEKKVRKDFIPDTYRELFRSIKKDLPRKQIQIVVGLRRVGKSTIIFQLIDELVKKTNPLNILYCNFDKKEFQEKTIEEILKEYSKLTNIDYKKEKIFLFLDEVQKAKRWVDDLKLVYDHFHNIKIIISGSASLNILGDAKKNLAGRAIYYELRPLSFNEFLLLKGIKIEKGKFLLYKNELEKEFAKFLLRPFPEIVNEEDTEFIKEYIKNSVIEPIILKDIPKEFEDVDIILLEKLLDLFLKNPGHYLVVDELSKDLKRSKKTIYNALFYLEFSFLIKRVLNYRPSIRVASRKLSRVYAYHPCLSLPYNIPEGKFVENLVFFELNAKYYWRDKEKEIDFLKEHLPIEVKYQNEINRHDLKHIQYFLNKYAKKLGVKKAYVITKETEEKIENIHLIPLLKFCFQGLE